jgi:diphthamide synthase (EF-2-diphthine--ammonia ligase)
MSDAVRAAVSEGFTHVAFGDLFLADIRAYREQQLAGSGLTPLFPLFGADTTTLARQMVVAGLRARLHACRRVPPRRQAGR